MANVKVRILFICLGNICRSPAAEGVMRHLVTQRELQDQVEIDSAGTSGYHIGEPPDKRMARAAKRRGIKLTSRSRQLNRHDLSHFDLVIAMDRSNVRAIHTAAAGACDRVRLLSDYLDTDQWSIEVPDPYFGGDDGFDHVLDMLQAACPALLDSLQLEADPHPAN